MFGNRGPAIFFFQNGTLTLRFNVGQFQFLLENLAKFLGGDVYFNGPPATMALSSGLLFTSSLVRSRAQVVSRLTISLSDHKFFGVSKAESGDFNGFYGD